MFTFRIHTKPGEHDRFIPFQGYTWMVQLLDSLQIMRFSVIYIKLIVLIPVLFTSTNTSRKPQIYYVLDDIVY